MAQGKVFKIEGNDISDGYHTFSELYEHRHRLFLALVKALPGLGSYWVPDHYEGWDLVVLELPDGQVSYHLPSSYRWCFESWLVKQPLEKHIYDGHTSWDVLDRLLRWTMSKGT